VVLSEAIKKTKKTEKRRSCPMAALRYSIAIHEANVP